MDGQMVYVFSFLVLHEFFKYIYKYDPSFSAVKIDERLTAHLPDCLP